MAARVGGIHVDLRQNASLRVDRERKNHLDLPYSSRNLGTVPIQQVP